MSGKTLGAENKAAVRPDDRPEILVPDAPGGLLTRRRTPQANTKAMT